MCMCLSLSLCYVVEKRGTSDPFGGHQSNYNFSWQSVQRQRNHARGNTGARNEQEQEQEQNGHNGRVESVVALFCVCVVVLTFSVCCVLFLVVMC